MTAKELWEERDIVHQQQEQRKAVEATLARKRRLDELAAKQDEWWAKIDAAIATGKTQGYTEAVKYLLELKELAERDGKRAAFNKRVQELAQTYRKRPSLLGELRKAKLVSG